MKSNRARKILKLTSQEKYVEEIKQKKCHLFEDSNSIPTTYNIYNNSNYNNEIMITNLSNLPIYNITEEHKYNSVNAWLESQQPNVSTNFNVDMMSYSSCPNPIDMFNEVTTNNNDSLSKIETESSKHYNDNGFEKESTYVINTIETVGIISKTPYII